MGPTADQMKRARQLRERHPVVGLQRRYSHFVRVMKFLLPSLATVLLALVLVWPRLVAEDMGFHVGFADLSPEAVKSLSMIDARYFGIDQNDHPYTVTADRATQRDQDSNLIDLVNPKADFSAKDGAGVYVEAERGVFHQKEQLLDLYTNVSLYHDKGYELHTQQARVDLKDNSAHGSVPVEGQGPQGSLQGDGFDIVDKGERVNVNGKSHLDMQAAGGSGSGVSTPAKKKPGQVRQPAGHAPDLSQGQGLPPIPAPVVETVP
jgi:lipopolysaccharide export system protein LptC